MTVSKRVRAIDNALVKNAQKSHYSKEVTFIHIARFINNYSTLAFKKGDVLKDTGLSEYGQRRNYKFETLYLVLRVTRCYVWVVDIYGRKGRTQLKINKTTGIAFITDYGGYKNTKPFNYVYEKCQMAEVDVQRVFKYALSEL
jgi:hypothetical protein